ncbi:MAG TPA: hypothetical protein DCM86_07280 [Verrucomicrobiales bacterium]|nr:hypothetical protein [Verrucomicrobiales bacterium]
MLKRFAILVAGLTVLGTLSGCVRTVDDRHRMGVPFLRDKIEGRYEAPIDKVLRAAKETLQLNGQLTGENTVINTVEGIIDGRHIWVRVDPVGDRWTRATVQARTRGGGADLSLASEVDKQIALRLATDKTVPPFVPAADPSQRSSRR